MDLKSDICKISKNAFVEHNNNEYLINLINNNKLNINDLSYEKRMSLMKTAHTIAINREEDEKYVEEDDEEEID